MAGTLTPRGKAIGPGTSSSRVKLERANAPPRIAIDLGTSSCSVAVCQNGVVRVIPDSSGKLSTPSLIAFTDRKRLVGGQAQSQVLRKPENLLYEVKRLIGRDYDSITEEEKKWWSFTVLKGESGEALLEVKSELLSSLISNRGNQVSASSESQFQHKEVCTSEAQEAGPCVQDDGKRRLAPEQILGMLLAKMKSDAETFLGCKELEAAVITVPALYSDRQRSATKLAAEIAGFKDVQLVSESTAAALCYAEHAGLTSSGRSDGVAEECQLGEEDHPRGVKLLMIALGGGNFEVAVVTIVGGSLTVDSVNGNPSLGGMDFDHKMMELILHRVREQFGPTPAINASTLCGLKTASEKAKEDLSTLQDVLVDVEFLLGGDNDNKVSIRRAEFEKRCKSLLDECMDCVRRLLKDTKTKNNEVSDAVFVGGSARIPKVFQKFNKVFHLEPKAHPCQDEAIVRGAALFAVWSQQVTETHATIIEYYDRRERTNFYFQQRKRPVSHVLPALSFWTRDPQDDQMCLELFERRGDKGEVVRVGKIFVRVGKHNVSPLLPLLTIDRCGMMGLDEGQSSLPAVFHKSGQRSPDEISGWRQLAEKLSVYERRVAEMSSARNQWNIYISEVEKRESSCPRWLWTTILEWKREIERWLAMEAGSGRVGIEQFTARFSGFQRACQYAFGDLWARSISGKRLLLVDCWESNDVDVCLRNLEKATLDFCDVVISVPLKDHRKTKERIIEGKGIEFAAHSFLSNATPATVKDNGIPYVVLSSGPVRLPGDGDVLCLEWNKLVGMLVSRAVQVGLQVVLCLEQDGYRDEPSSSLPYAVDDENRRCEAQLKALLQSIGPSNWRNITIAYLPPPNLCWAKELPRKEAANPQQSGVLPRKNDVLDTVLPQRNEVLDTVLPRKNDVLDTVLPRKNDVLDTVRHIRKVIGDFVSAEAAKTTRILTGGGAALELWNVLMEQDEIDGFLLEGGFRDSRLLKRLHQPTREGTSKALLCRAADGDAILDQRNMECMHNVSRDLMAGEEVDWIPVKYKVTEINFGVHRDEGTGSIGMVWKGGAIVQDDNNNKGKNRRRVKIVPIFELWDGEKLQEGIEKQLSPWREEIKRTDDEGEKLVLEYRPVSCVDMAGNLPVVIETAHALIRRWVLTNTSPEVARAVRIVCSLDGLPPETYREITRNPNVDGASLRLDSAGDAQVSAGSAPANESQLAERLTVRSARHQWKKYIDEVEKKESSCQRWLWSVILERKRDMERWLGRKEVEGGCVEREQFTSRFAEFRRACEYAFGALWGRSMSGKKFLIVDCWYSSEIKQCLQNLVGSRGRDRDLCDVVISMPLKDLRKTKERIAKTEGIRLAVLSLSPHATPDALAQSGIPYVLLKAGPAVMDSGEREHLCSGWNKIVGDQVSLALQAGLHVVLCIGRNECDYLEVSNEARASELEEEKRHCEAQIRDIVSRVGKDFRNIAVAYLPPSHVLPAATTEATIEAAATTEATIEAAATLATTEAATKAAEATSRPQWDASETARHIRCVIKDLVSAEAAEETRILIGRCEEEESWDTFINLRHEIDGFLLVAGLRDPLFFDKLVRKGGPSEKIRRERKGKVLLCGLQDENATLSMYDVIWLSAITEKLMGAEEVVWIKTKHIPTLAVSSGTSMITEINGTYAFLWKGGHVTTDYSGEVEEARKAKIFPILESHNDSRGQEVAEALSPQLSALWKELEVKKDSDWSGLLLEYRPADGVNSADSLLEAVERAHAHIRGWLLENFGAEAAQEVRIVCFLEDELESETRRQIVHLPNVDGVSLHLPDRRTVRRTGLAA
ncbi:hypothetical protein CBR_g50821 [Chara braunii]|uniref:Uncharacterized protein n=1 Tax=Chara braunii TaxID=69332 RepID=A0A388M7I9_CHABU|nr:hypothetical protein CBR_g50821 [Chara braunii]|eukprot:GBG90475.1 hypothetical protein CBR_g50821 [Chara braunii]